MDECRILIVDDDVDVARALATELTALRHHCEIATDGAAALAACRQLAFDVVLSDLRMEGMDGQELLAHLQRLQPELPVILVTADTSVPAAVSAVKRGAFNYLTKPVDGRILRDVVAQALALRGRGRRPSRPPSSGGLYDLVGASPVMAELRARIELVSRAVSPVLVQGETGTGKELVARAIHACSSRRARPFVSVNASAIPEALLESEMFGHARGAFTGAAQSHRGLFAEADGGTLLLDEIGDMPLGLQAKLLRVLQSGEVRSLGAERASHVDVRVVAATHRNLAELVGSGRFREDLYYRLNVVSVDVAPLRSRPQDIPELAAFFFDRARARAPESPARRLSPGLPDALAAATWPGNVRELENAIERLVVLAVQEELTPSDLAAHLTRVTAPTAEGTDPDLERLIHRHVEGVLATTKGNKAHAAKLLGVDLSTLYRWQRKWRG